MEGRLRVRIALNTVFTRGFSVGRDAAVRAVDDSTLVAALVIDAICVQKKTYTPQTM